MPKNKLKITLHKVLISILVKEGGYVDVATLINTLKKKLNKTTIKQRIKSVIIIYYYYLLF